MSKQNVKYWHLHNFLSGFTLNTIVITNIYLVARCALGLCGMIIEHLN